MDAPPSTKQTDGTGLVAWDPWLEPYANALRHRHRNFLASVQRIVEASGSLAAFSRGHQYFGLNREQQGGRPGVSYREWAPGAQALFLMGDFNGWDRQSHPLNRDAFGVWSIFLPDDQYADRLVHASRLKVHVQSAAGAMDRIPAYVRRVVYDEPSGGYCGQYWQPQEPFAWQHAAPRIANPRIYEAHVGMATEQERVGTYREFTRDILPRIADAGYNALQLMAIQEHPYYGSFGYQVTNFFAPSSRFGTPEELKELIDTAHGLGLIVLLDLVHSHCAKNTHEGLNLLDGTDHLYFHAGPRGEHPAWDSKLFNYGNVEVLRFLLSNVRYWLEEFRFDGFRFDGVTSMMYLHHGFQPFTSYDDYLVRGLDEDALAYLQLANQVAHDANPNAITIAEDVSGMVGLARPLDEGGIGFNYRLAMGIPDYWIKLLKEVRDEDWPMAEIFRTLTNRRRGEKHIAYAESHDQAIVGDKTIAFWLMDADMYWLMSKLVMGNLKIERGVALHKMIRLITFALGGEGYLNFMGNEFGHPEWIDFPRQGNNFSYKYARRQWSLTDDPLLRYRDLATFDRDLQGLDRRFNLLGEALTEPIYIDESGKLIACRRGPLVFVFNFHPSRSHADYRIGVPEPTDYKVILNTDDFWYGGHGIVSKGQIYPRQNVPTHGRDQSIQVYIPTRTAQVLSKA
jgi:1,4-alpha-glucan branching enzyme